MPRSDADVIVIGVGTMGSAALWRAAERGARVLGVEQHEIGHDRGSGHGESRIIRTAYHEHPAYVPLVRSAWRAWRSLERDSGAELLTRTGALMIGPPTGGLIAGVLEAVRSHDLAHELLDPPAAAARFPQHMLGDDDVAVVEPDAGFLRPERAIGAMTSAVVAAGAQIETRTRVLGIEPSGGAVAVRLADRTISAQHVIVCCGSWIGTLVPELAGVLTIERQVPMWFPVRGTEHPIELFQPGRLRIKA